MRQKRAKVYKRLMALYSMSFGFRQPYQVLVDSTFCEYAVKNKIEIAKQLDAVLQGQAKPMITQCSMVELHTLGPTQQHVVDVAKGFERRKCNHREAIPNDECIKSVVGDSNKHRYVVASQSPELRTILRAVPSVPLVHVNRVVMVLEPPTQATLRAKALLETTAQSARAPEIAAIVASSKTQPFSSSVPVAGSSSEPATKIRKGPKGPNPLSVKKKKEPSKSTPQSQKKGVVLSGKGKQRESNDESNMAGKKRKRGIEQGDEQDEGNGKPAVVLTPTPTPLIDGVSPVKVDIIESKGGGGTEGRSGRKRRRRKAPKALADAVEMDGEDDSA